MVNLPERKTERLRLGRVSLPGARYFVTACIRVRCPVFSDEVHAQRVRAAVHDLHEAGDWRLLAGTIMPDHVHVLFTLGERLSLDRVIAKWKARARASKADWRWQANFFEHRLRADEDTEEYAFYIFMNPYRAGLVGANEGWSGWLRGADWRWRFEDALNREAGPPREWLGRVEELAGRIQIGE